MASRSITFRSRRLRQIIDLRDTDKSRYFAITEFNNCFIIRSPSLFFIIIFSDSFREAIYYFHTRAWFQLRMRRILFAAKISKTQLDSIAHKHTIIYRQLFAGHVDSSRPMKRKKKMHRMIRSFSNDDVDSSENVTIKMNSPFYKRRSWVFQLALSVKCRWNFLELNSWRLHSSLEGERKISCRVFTPSMKSPIRKFHVLVVQWRQQNEPKSIMHVQSCCFGYCFFDVLVAVAVVVP